MSTKLKKEYNWSDCLDQTLSDMFDRASSEMNKTQTRESEKDAYRCIHLPVRDFIIRMDEVVSTHGSYQDCKPKKFLDVGCGVGQKVYLAKAMFDLDGYGLEFRPEHAQKARELMTQFTGADCSQKIITGNAITYDGTANSITSTFMFRLPTKTWSSNWKPPSPMELKSEP